MPKQGLLPNWGGADAYVIGGGHSLKTFDFDQLRPLNVIGCNQAFRLGAEICKVCIFGDFKFWYTFQPQMSSSYEGYVATDYRTNTCPVWLHAFTRLNEGLCPPGNTLAWNTCTGASAINLALMMGAKRVFLLGYDCQLGPKPEESHWHDAAIEVPKAEHYQKFMRGFQNIADKLGEVYPGTQVINVNEGTSRVQCFPHSVFADAGLVAPFVLEAMAAK